MFSLKPQPFVQSLLCMRPDSHTYSYFYLFLPFFENVAFSVFFCTTTVFSLYGEYVVPVRFFLPDDGVSLPCDHELDF